MFINVSYIYIYIYIYIYKGYILLINPINSSLVVDLTNMNLKSYHMVTKIQRKLNKNEKRLKYKHII